MKNQPYLFIIAPAAALLGAISLQGATLPVAEDFSGATLGETLPGRVTTTGGATWATDDTAQFPVFIDRGDGDMAIEWTKGTGTNEHAFDIPPMTRGVYSVDINFVQDGDDNGTVKDAITMRVATISTMTAGTFAAGFVDRSIQGIELNTWRNLMVIFNGEETDLLYDRTGLSDTNAKGGFGVVTPGKADVFLDGNLMTDEATGTIGTFNYAGFVAFKSPTVEQIVRFDNFSVNEVVEDNTPRWAGYPVDVSGWVDTTPWLGWINVSQGDYIWSIAFSKYIYLPEGWVGTSGSWTYIPAN